MPTAGVVFGTASAAAFGLGDFLGALAARRSPALLVAAGGQLVGLIALSAAALVLRPALPDAAGIALAVAAGVAGATGISALYRGMAVGSMGLVTSLAGAGALVVPLVASAVTGATMAPIQIAGVACAGGAAAAAGSASRGKLGRLALGMAVLAALGFGSWYVLVDLAARAGDPMWALVISRASGTLVAGAAALAGARREVGVPVRLIATAGIADAGGNVLYVVARGALPVGLAAALTGLYPVVTVLLARLILGERLSRNAQLAVVLALAGILLISLGTDLQ